MKKPITSSQIDTGNAAPHPDPAADAVRLSSSRRRRRSSSRSSVDASSPSQSRHRSSSSSHRHCFLHITSTSPLPSRSGPGTPPPPPSFQIQRRHMLLPHHVDCSSSFQIRCRHADSSSILIDPVPAHASSTSHRLLPPFRSGASTSTPPPLARSSAGSHISSPSHRCLTPPPPIDVAKVSKLKHENFVELLGYCFEGNLRLLSYEFATMGSSHDILHGRKGVNLRRCLQI